MNEFSERISVAHGTRERRFFRATPRRSLRLGAGYRLMLGVVCSLLLLGHGLAMGRTPVVSIASPSNEQTVSGIVPIVTKIVQPPLIWENFYVDGNKIASSPPYTVNWDASAAQSGQHIIEVDAFARNGKLIGRASVTVQVVSEASSATPSSFATLPPHATLPSGATCAQEIAPSSWEPRPENYIANHTSPSTAELAAFYAAPLNFSGGPPSSDFQRVDGDFTGTTAMILRWAACKWGMDENQMLAQAFQESWWSAYTTGDLRTDPSQCSAGQWDGWQTNGAYCYQSYGLLQLKMASYNAWPMAWNSTAFNADFRGAYWRACMNGDVQYYFDQTPVSGYPTYPNGSTDEMAWGCVGSWYSGGWYDSAAIGYIASVKAEAAAKPWLSLPVGSSPVLTLTAPANNATVSGSVAISITLNQSDPKACYACYSIDGAHGNCVPAVGPWIWDTTNHVLNGHHAIQVDSYTCAGSGPNYHAAVDVNVNN